MAGRGLALAAIASVACIASAGRVGRAGRWLRSSASEPAGASKFAELEQCQAGYDTLYAQCDGPMSSEAGHTGAKGREGGLKHDERGGRDHAGEFGEPHKANGMPAYASPNGWDYRSHGEDWDDYAQCSAGNQSPIDLPKYIDTQGQTKFMLWFDYFLDPTVQDSTVRHMTNEGHGLRYDIDKNKVDMGFVKIGNEEYAASEYVFHAPSEHSMGGAVFPLELQIYNKGKDTKGIVAISILFREGPSNEFIKGLKDSMDDRGPSWNPRDGKGIGNVKGLFPAAFDLEGVIPKGDVSREASFYNYQGSLTQPPCTEGVDWWVLSQPITATRDEIRFIRKAIFNSESTRHGNARATHPVGDRHVWVGLTGFQHGLKVRRKHDYVWSDHQEPRGYSSHDMPWGDHWEETPAGPAGAPGPAAAGPAGAAASPA